MFMGAWNYIRGVFVGILVDLIMVLILLMLLDGSRGMMIGHESFGFVENTPWSAERPGRI